MHEGRVSSEQVEQEQLTGGPVEERGSRQQQEREGARQRVGIFTVPFVVFPTF